MENYLILATCLPLRRGNVCNKYINVVISIMRIIFHLTD